MSLDFLELVCDICSDLGIVVSENGVVERATSRIFSENLYSPCLYSAQQISSPLNN